jgi:hypothetical protein
MSFLFTWLVCIETIQRWILAWYVKNLVEWELGGETDVFEKNAPFHSVHHKFHIWPGTAPEPPRWDIKRERLLIPMRKNYNLQTCRECGLKWRKVRRDKITGRIRPETCVFRQDRRMHKKKTGAELQSIPWTVRWQENHSQSLMQGINVLPSQFSPFHIITACSSNIQLSSCIFYKY